MTEIVNVIKSREWEPSAKSGLITLCTKKFGYDEVARALAPELSKCEMRDRAIAEWKKRSLREGDLPVMSARYPTSYCGEESKKYVESVLSFIGNDISNCRLLELGCGIGRFTQHFAKIAQTVTAVDLSQEMIDIAQKQLKGADNVTFLNAFIQDLNISATYDVAISSLVLIHNPDDDDFFDAIDALKKSAKVIFLFEHIDDSAQVSSFTKPRSERVLLECFQGFLVERKRKYKLFDDNILFLKLLKKMKNTA